MPTAVSCWSKATESWLAALYHPVEVVRSIPGRRQLCLEEGSLAGWDEVLSPQVEELVVAAVSESRVPTPGERRRPG